MIDLVKSLIESIVKITPKPVLAGVAFGFLAGGVFGTLVLGPQYHNFLSDLIIADRDRALADARTRINEITAQNSTHKKAIEELGSSLKMASGALEAARLEANQAAENVTSLNAEVSRLAKLASDWHQYAKEKERELAQVSKVDEEPKLPTRLPVALREYIHPFGSRGPALSVDGYAGSEGKLFVFKVRGLITDWESPVRLQSGEERHFVYRNRKFILRIDWDNVPLVAVKSAA